MTSKGRKVHHINSPSELLYNITSFNQWLYRRGVLECNLNGTGVCTNGFTDSKAFIKSVFMLSIQCNSINQI